MMKQSRFQLLLLILYSFPFQNAMSFSAGRHQLQKLLQVSIPTRRCDDVQTIPSRWQHPIRALKGKSMFLELQRTSTNSSDDLSKSVYQKWFDFANKNFFLLGMFVAVGLARAVPTVSDNWPPIFAPAEHIIIAKLVTYNHNICCFLCYNESLARKEWWHIEGGSCCGEIRRGLYLSFVWTFTRAFRAQTGSFQSQIERIRPFHNVWTLAIVDWFTFDKISCESLSRATTWTSSRRLADIDLLANYNQHVYHPDDSSRGKCCHSSL